MDLVFFDLDGTLLNNRSQLSPFTRETLGLLNDKGIAHTIATGRTMHSAQQVMGGHVFSLPHIYSNGVAVWDPKEEALTLENLLDEAEFSTIIECAVSHDITPFINTVELAKGRQDHIVYHAQPRHQIEKDLINKYFSSANATLLPIESFSQDCLVTKISMIGDVNIIRKMSKFLNSKSSLIAYSGPSVESKKFSWMDIHHRLANKGSAVENLKKQLGASNVICFGDSDNDLSMFALADECYAPDNAKEAVKQTASAVIGHHHDEGVARFLRERFSL